jgi:hypothetical protein
VKDLLSSGPALPRSQFLDLGWTWLQRGLVRFPRRRVRVAMGEGTDQNKSELLGWKSHGGACGVVEPAAASID